MFFDFPVSVSVDTIENQVDNFPAVTICNINPFDSSKNSTKEFCDYALKMGSRNSTITATDDKPAIYEFRQNMNLIKATALSMLKSNSSLIKNIGFSMESMLISCFFNGEKCSALDFTSTFTFEYGLCHTFNRDPNKIKKTSKAGPNNGLSLELFIGYPGLYHII